MPNKILETIELSKHFANTVALDKANFDVEMGEIHALVGENGAGKSTLIKIICGIYRKNSGQIFFKGIPVDIKSSREAQLLGISVVYQEINLVPGLSVAENLYLGRETTVGGIAIDRRTMIRDTQRLLDSLGFGIRADMPAMDLAVGQGHLVEIARAIFWDAELIIMDEPTAALSNQEVNILFDLCIQLKKKGKSIVYISHRLQEVKNVADRATIMRDGKIVAVLDKQNLDLDIMVKHMIGRSLEKGKYPKRSSPIHSELIRVENLSCGGYIKNISFSLRSGEILGVAGLMGSGRTMLLRSIYGAEEKTSGKMFMEGKDYSRQWPGKGIVDVFGLITEDRKGQSLVVEHSIESNIELGKLARITRYGFIKRKLGRMLVDKFIKTYQINPPDRSYACKYLSGGNQQKVCVSKALFGEPRVILMDEPTKGIDVGSKWEIHRLIREELCPQDIGIIIASSELPELIGMCDRILVLFKGTMVLVLENRQFSQEVILKAASGL